MEKALLTNVKQLHFITMNQKHLDVYTLKYVNTGPVVTNSGLLPVILVSVCVCVCMFQLDSYKTLLLSPHVGLCV